MEEYQALATAIRYLMALVTWPGSPDRPLKLAVIGGYGFRTDLNAAFGQGTVWGRKVEVKYVNQSTFLERVQDFDAVFISPGEESRLPLILSKIHGKPLLTMGYAEGLARKGVMVNFMLESNRITLEIHTGQVKDAGLKIGRAHV